MKILDNMKIDLGAVGILWVVYLFDAVLPIDLIAYGLRPRSMDGLWGIAFSPFLHLDLRHLAANTGALFILLTVSLVFNRKLTIVALLIIVFAGGGLVWSFGNSNTVHIGASGIIFGLIGFLMFIGVFRREWVALLFSVVILFSYGGALLSLLAYKQGISWSGHFFGFLSGVMAAWWTKSKNKEA
jgi:membrane associated rhomboid family serine protease